MEDIIKSYKDDQWAAENLTTALVNPSTDPKINVAGGLVRYKSRLYVGTTGSLRQELIAKLHESALRDHSGQNGTYQSIKALFYWKGLKKDVKEWVRSCDTCQKCKNENVASPRLL